MAGKRQLRLGTRGSALALCQTKWVASALARLHPDLEITLIKVVTTGDQLLNKSFGQMPGKGVFVKEIEEKLLSHEIDLAVHSMKDLPTEFPPGLKIAAIARREDPRDVLVTRLGLNLADMPDGATIGTSSLRRSVQLLKFRPDFNIVELRGNIDTRLRKAETEKYDGIILAAAGLARMGWQDRIQEYLEVDVMIPAAGQGAIGIEVRDEDPVTQKLLEPLNHALTEVAVRAERIFLQGMGGGCHAPVGALCTENKGQALLRAFFAEADGSSLRTSEITGPFAEAERLATALVQRFKGNA